MAGGFVDINITLAGEEQISRRLGLASEAVRDLRPAWEAIHTGRQSSPLLVGVSIRGAVKGQSNSFVYITKRQFATKGKRGGTPWPKYDAEPIYRIIKRKFGGGLGNMLRWTPGNERLYPSMISPTHPEHVFVSRQRSVAMGTSVPYAIRHQRGTGLTKHDKVPLPKRPLIATTADDRRGWIRIIQRHVMRTVGKAARRSLG